jgi:hypothetical protein
MTDQQLYLAIGVPVVLNSAILAMALSLQTSQFNHRIDDLKAQLNQRFDDLRDLWRAELRRVEEVLDARLKHIEENR